MTRAEYKRIKITKGFGAGINLVAQVVSEDGQQFYVCKPDHSFEIWYPAEFVEVLNEKG